MNAPVRGVHHAELFYFIRMRASPVTGHTADRGDSCTFIIFIKAKIFFIDLTRHSKHMAGDILFRFGIAGKIQAMGIAIGRRCMTKTTFDTQGSFPTVHYFLQIVMADIFG